MWQPLPALAAGNALGRAGGGRQRAGRRALASSLPSFLDACRGADQPEVSLCSFRPVFAVSE